MRISQDLHQRAALYAEEHYLKLNAVVQLALKEYLRTRNSGRSIPHPRDEMWGTDRLSVAYVATGQVGCINWRRRKVARVRNLLILLALTLSPLGAVGLGSPGSKISQLPDGVLSGNVYSNDALGLKFNFPRGWIATADPKGPIGLGFRTQDGPVDQCIKVLLSFQAPHPVEGRFSSGGDVIVIDPGCFSDLEFPTSANKKKVQDFAGIFIKFFSAHTLHIAQRC